LRNSADTIPFLFQEQTSYSCPNTPTGDLITPRCSASLPPLPPKEKLSLPYNLSSSINLVTVDTVAQVIEEKAKKYLIIDCRFEYEYHGGHIKGALNFPKEEDVDKFFIKETKYHMLREKICIVFHCEFSSHRGPKSYKRVRSSDRKLNEPNYPELFYPEMYLLEGGYKQFFKDFPDLCDPQAYVEMKDPCYIPQMRIGMQNRGRSKSQRRFFTQSCTNLSLELQNPNPNPSPESDDDSKSKIVTSARHVNIRTMKERN